MQLQAPRLRLAYSSHMLHDLYIWMLAPQTGDEFHRLATDPHNCSQCP